MLFLGLLIAAISAAMMTVATLQLSQVNEGHYLPMTIGKFAVRSPWKVTASDWVRRPSRPWVHG
ncbi:hypothetical protein CH281_23195 [Rhodococcus sp. 06-221-2]|uniref:hypothetical protein n=1 Tax=Rhodococcus sp. 06-221-2 TaxID=2022514 RepID=UPI000B9C494D|nr:hypothetical protein [Rhodococcus sp. 06-221-2]OZC96769.1 hypothetical protein CH281_23195 [Rhodococcus sp. 06-221-2]